MKPYIGILIDSFWEAVNNKVLWALLICWTLLLACLAPFGYISESSYKLSSADIDNRSQLLEQIAKSGTGSKGGRGAAISAVVERLDEAFVEKVKKAEDDDSIRIRSSELAEELNKVVEKPDLYSKEAFPTAERRKRLKPLIEAAPEDLSNQDLIELNRELLQLAFPLELNSPMGEQLWVGYGTLKIGSPLQISRRQIREFLEPLALQLIIKLGLGILAVFVAIIVTSPIIPDTFRSGSLHLLLSKPISRMWLYLSKFFGGTIFVFVNITYVLVGLFFIAGLRFDIWNTGLLACIPILMFVFLIFYAVSGLAALLWGNAIVCVVSCMIFWFGCFCLSFAREFMRNQIEIEGQVVRVQPIGDAVTVVNQRGDFAVWNEEFSVWQPATRSRTRGPQVRTFGPIYLEDKEKVLIKSFIRTPFGGGFGDRKLGVISLDSSPSSDVEAASPGGGSEDDKDSSGRPQETNEGSSEVGSEDPATDTTEEQAAASEGAAEEPASEDSSADSQEIATRSTPENSEEAEEEAEEEGEEDGAEDTASASVPTNIGEAREKPRWTVDDGPEIPAQLFGFEQLDDSVIAVCRGGLYRLDLEQLEMLEAGENALFGLLKLTQWGSNSAFKNIAPEDYFLSDNSEASALADGSGLVIYSSGNVDVLKLNNSQFELAANTKLDGGEGTEAALIEMNASFCVVVRHELPMQILDSELNLKQEVELQDDQEVKQISWVPGTNRLAIVTHAGDMLQLDCEAGELTETDLPISGDVACMHWLDAENVLVVLNPYQVFQLDLSTGTVVESYQPSRSVFETVYWFAVNPLYKVFPKPAALDDAMTYVLTGSETQTMNIVTNDLEATQLKLDVWTPILSNSAFVLVILGLSSIYVSRKEF